MILLAFVMNMQGSHESRISPKIWLVSPPVSYPLLYFLGDMRDRFWGAHIRQKLMQILSSQSPYLPAALIGQVALT